MTRERYTPPEIQIEGVEDGWVSYTLICQRCGGYETTVKGDGSIMSMVHCAACGTWLGRVAALNAHAAIKAADEGFDVNRRDYTSGGRFCQGIPARPPRRP